MIYGFTKYDDKYYMVASNLFYHCYSRYGFCSACGILRCSPVWCICGHKELSDGWTSNNKELDSSLLNRKDERNQRMTHIWNGFHMTYYMWVIMYIRQQQH